MSDQTAVYFVAYDGEYEYMYESRELAEKKVAEEIKNNPLDNLEAVRESIHANCKRDNPQCACACGCDERIGCACFTPLCLDCHMNWLRGRDAEPGKPECEYQEG